MAKGIIGHPCGIKGNDEQAMATWKSELMTIANGFEAARDIIDLSDILYKKVGDKEVLDKAMYKKKEKEMNNGLDLFKKRFLNLWD